MAMTPRIYKLQNDVRDKKYLMINIKGEGSF